MTTRKLLYALDCDICGARLGTADNPFELMGDARAQGWRLRRRLDGKIARRGGLDYCPPCIPAFWGAES